MCSLPTPNRARCGVHTVDPKFRLRTLYPTLALPIARSAATSRPQPRHGGITRREQEKFKMYSERSHSSRVWECICAGKGQLSQLSWKLLASFNWGILIPACPFIGGRKVRHTEVMLDEPCMRRSASSERTCCLSITCFKPLRSSFSWEREVQLVCVSRRSKIPFTAFNAFLRL